MQGPFTAGPLTNPTANTILADSGAQPIAGFIPSFVVAATIGAVVVLEWRNAANDANLWSQVFPIQASSPYSYTFPGSVEVLSDGERFRLRLNATVVGQVQASLFV